MILYKLHIFFCGAFCNFALDGVIYNYRRKLDRLALKLQDLFVIVQTSKEI